MFSGVTELVFCTKSYFKVHQQHAFSSSVSVFPKRWKCRPRRTWAAASPVWKLMKEPQRETKMTTSQLRIKLYPATCGQ